MQSLCSPSISFRHLDCTDLTADPLQIHLPLWAAQVTEWNNVPPWEPSFRSKEIRDIPGCIQVYKKQVWRWSKPCINRCYLVWGGKCQLGPQGGKVWITLWSVFTESKVDIVLVSSCSDDFKAKAWYSCMVCVTFTFMHWADDFVPINSADLDFHQELLLWFYLVLPVKLQKQFQVWYGTWLNVIFTPNV